MTLWLNIRALTVLQPFVRLIYFKIFVCYVVLGPLQAVVSKNLALCMVVFLCQYILIVVSNQQGPPESSVVQYTPPDRVVRITLTPTFQLPPHPSSLYFGNFHGHAHKERRIFWCLSTNHRRHLHIHKHPPNTNVDEIYLCQTTNSRMMQSLSSRMG